MTVLSIGGGWLSGTLIARGWTTTAGRKSCMLLFAVAVVPIALASHVGNWTAVLLIGLVGAAHQAWSATLYTTVSDMFPQAGRRHPGRDRHDGRLGPAGWRSPS